jgi:regulator of chromosome condensation
MLLCYLSVLLCLQDKRDRVRKLAAGARHMLALTRRGEVLSWGIAGQGQLGRVPRFNNEEYPAADVLLQPTAVKGFAAAIGPDVVDIGTGSYASFAIGPRGAVAAWGLNNGGQLGLPVAADKDAEQCVWEPTAVPALSKGVHAIAGGEHHSLALTRQHKVLSFGSSNYGMLGRRDIPKPVGKETICLPNPEPVDESDGLAEEKVLGIAAGMHVSSCVTDAGNAFTWGSNVNYQMAKGQDEDDNEQPTRMRRHKAFGNRRVLQFCFGGQHAALLASADEQEEAAAAAAAQAAAAAPVAAATDDAGTSAAAEAGAAAAEKPAAASKKRKGPAADEPAAEQPAAAAEEELAAAEAEAAASKGKRARKAPAAAAAPAAPAAKDKAPAAKKRKA